MILRIVLTSFFILVSSISFAADAKWNSTLEAGLVLTGGNSETQSGSAKFNTIRDSEQWKHTLKLEALNASSTNPITGQEATIAEKYSGKVIASYKLPEDSFLFGNLSYDDDRFSGFEYQSTLALGYGRYLIKEEKQSLQAEIGPGIYFFEVTGADDSDSEGILHAAGRYQYNFDIATHFLQEIIVLKSSDQTITESVSTLQSQIVKKLSMKASFKLRKTSEVPAGVDDTDTETSLTLAYAF